MASRTPSRFIPEAALVLGGVTAARQRSCEVASAGFTPRFASAGMATVRGPVRRRRADLGSAGNQVLNRLDTQPRTIDNAIKVQVRDHPPRGTATCRPDHLPACGQPCSWHSAWWLDAADRQGFRNRATYSSPRIRRITTSSCVRAKEGMFSADPDTPRTDRNS